MFTGIVQKVADVRAVRNRGTASSVQLDLAELTDEVKTGDSVMVDGVCLTATDFAGGQWAFDVSSETLRRTTLGDLQPGFAVNVELAMRPSDRFGGHFVSGHVDGVGQIRDLSKKPGETRMRVKTDPTLSNQMILKGSVAVDGISLTIAELGDGYFEVSLIPHTMDATTLPKKKTGDDVNIECDMIGKWVKKFTQQEASDDHQLSMDTLRENGF